MSVNKFKAVNIVIQCKQTCDLYDALLLNYHVLKCSISVWAIVYRFDILLYRYLGTVRCCFVDLYIIGRNLFSHLSNKKRNILKHKEFIRWNNHCSLYLLNGGWVQKWNYRNVYSSRCIKKNISWHNCCCNKIWSQINHMKHSEAIRSNEFLLLRFLLRRPKLQIIQFFLMSWIKNENNKSQKSWFLFDCEGQ